MDKVDWKQLPILVESAKGAIGITAAALIMAEIAVYFVYSGFGAERLVFEFITTASITVLVAAPIGFYISLQKAKLRQLSVKLSWLANHDPLSGLPNRRKFLGEVRDNVENNRNHRGVGSFLFIDADHFKLLNDTFGHSAGDDAIRHISEVIEKNLGEGDAAGRIGGEEFGVFLDTTHYQSALKVAEKICRGVRQIRFEDGDKGHRMSVSIGVSTHEPGQSLREFVQAADESLTIAKSAGRNQIVFDSDMQQSQQVALH